MNKYIRLSVESFEDRALMSATLAAATPEPPMYEIKLEDVMISSWQTSANGDRPMESLSLNYTKITYNPAARGDIFVGVPTDDGAGDDLIATYDLKALKKI